MRTPEPPERKTKAALAFLAVASTRFWRAISGSSCAAAGRTVDARRTSAARRCLMVLIRGPLAQGHLDLHLGLPPDELDFHDVADLLLQDLLAQVHERFHFHPVQGLDDVAHLDARLPGRAALHHSADDHALDPRRVVEASLDSEEGLARAGRLFALLEAGRELGDLRPQEGETDAGVLADVLG